MTKVAPKFGIILFATCLTLAFAVRLMGSLLPGHQLVFVASRNYRDGEAIVSVDLEHGLNLFIEQPSYDDFALSSRGVFASLNEENNLFAIDLYTEQQWQLTPDDVYDFPRFVGAWSPDGRALAFVASDNDDDFQLNARIYLSEGTVIHNLMPAQPFLAIGGMTWSADATRILFTGRENDASPASLYTINVNDWSITKLSPADLNSRTGMWSPDGTSIVFAGSHNLVDDIYVMDSDGGNVRNLTNSPDNDDRLPVWSPDGTQIAFLSISNNYSGMYLMDADGNNARRIAGISAQHDKRMWSSDGMYIAIMSENQRGFQIDVLHTGTGERRRLSYSGITGYSPVWLP